MDRIIAERVVVVVGGARHTASTSHSLSQLRPVSQGWGLVCNIQANMGIFHTGLADFVMFVQHRESN